MPSTQPFGEWFDGLKNGRSSAERQLYEGFYVRLVHVARRKLSQIHAQRRAADEEDVAQEAFASFCKAVRLGRLANLADRDQLLRLLVSMTERKAVDQKRRELRQKRGRGLVVGESAAIGRQANGDQQQFGDRADGKQRKADSLAKVADDFAAFLSKLPDELHRTIAIAKMEGLTDSEIGQRTGRCLRNVQRCWGNVLRIGRRLSAESDEE